MVLQAHNQHQLSHLHVSRAVAAILQRSSKVDVGGGGGFSSRFFDFGKKHGALLECEGC